MTRAKRKIEADLKLVDLVIELLDARCPKASENPDIKKLTSGKKRLVLLNKSDLADERATAEWVDYFAEQGIRAIPLDSRGRDSIEKVKKSAAELTKEKREKERAKGIIGDRPLRAMILGIPNVGKSTFINSMLGKASAKTGNKPGVTKGNQWININNDLLLLDTPGVLWPKFDDPETAVCLAEIGSISDQVIQAEELAVKLLDFLYEYYRDRLLDRFGISEEAFAEKKDAINVEVLGVSVTALALMDLIAVKRGCIKKKAEPDYERCAKMLLEEFRSGKLGRISLQRPEGRKKEEA